MKWKIHLKHSSAEKPATGSVLRLPFCCFSQQGKKNYQVCFQPHKIEDKMYFSFLWILHQPWTAVEEHLVQKRQRLIIITNASLDRSHGSAGKNKTVYFLYEAQILLFVDWSASWSLVTHNYNYHNQHLSLFSLIRQLGSTSLLLC